jgi:2-phospho-L-lactate guanylyltransferase (CobY/MobA/RfbA family)
MFVKQGLGHLNYMQTSTVSGTPPERTMFFRHTLTEIRTALRSKYPEAQPVPLDIESAEENHLLYLLEEIERIPRNSNTNSAKANWGLSKLLVMVESLELISTAHIQELMQADEDACNHVFERPARLRIH